jgi:UDP:flavonoid glycosyltransferase YjiC (YdhE family)
MTGDTYNFLLASWGSSGNLSPLLTAGRQLRRRGHCVRIIADPAYRADVERSGFGFAAWQRAPVGIAADPPDFSSKSDFLKRAIFQPAPAYAADIQNEIGRRPTDAVLCIDFLLGVAIGAEAACIPCALLSPHISMRPLPGVPPAASGMKPPATPEEHAKFAAETNTFIETFNEHLPILNDVRRRHALAPLGHVLDAYDRVDRVLLAISEAFDFAPERLPANVRYVGPLLDPPSWSGEWRSPWSGPADRPRALLTFSSGAQNQEDLARRVVAAMGRVEIDAVATAGPALDPAILQPPENVKVLRSASHDDVMKEVSLVVTQGGHGTVSRALIHGLPLLVLPMGRDQDDNAARVEVKGAGLALPHTASETEIAAAVNRLIREPHFRIAAHRLGEAMAADVAASSLVREMEAIADSRVSPAYASTAIAS